MYSYTTRHRHAPQGNKVRNIRQVVVLAISILLAARCDEDSERRPTAVEVVIADRSAVRRYALEPVQHLPDAPIDIETAFGSPQGNSIDMPSGQRPTMRLRYIQAIAEAPDGGLFIVDAETKLLMRLEGRQGGVATVIAGGYGDGPGQFVRPYKIFVRDASVYVLDSELARVTAFDTAGRLLGVTSTPVRNAFAFVVRDTLLWVMRNYRGSRSTDAVSVFSLSGIELATAFRTRQRERSFALGYTGQLALTDDGAVLFAHPQPGTWTEIDSAGRELRRGLEAMPTAQMVIEPVAPRLSKVYPPGGTVAIGQIAEDRIAILWARQRQSQPSSIVDRRSGVEMTYYVDVFSRHGAYMGTTMPIKGRFFTAAEFGRTDYVLYVAVQEPYVHVIEYDIRELPLDAATHEISNETAWK